MKTLKAVEPQKIVPIHFNFRGSVPIPINRSIAEIGAVQVTLNEKKIKTWAEIGAILVNPLREKIQTRIVTWSLVIMFSFLQIAPTGWAATRPVPVDELQARSVPGSVAALTNASAVTQPVPAPKKPVVSLDSTAFLADNGPLSKAEPKTTLVEPIYVGPPVKVDHTPTFLGPPVKVDSTPTLIGPPVKVDDVPTLIGPPERAYDVKVITDPATGRELSVTIDEHGLATVKWGDQEYKGFFDPRTNSVILVTNDNAVWTLQFGNNEKGELYLQTFQSRSWNDGGYSEETYTYNQQGQLTRKDWQTEYSYSLDCFRAPCPGEGYHSGKSGGTIDYIQINGKTLVSHEKTWSENNGMILYEQGDIKEDGAQYLRPFPSGRSETENWYSYDNQGNLLAKNWNSTDGYGGSSFGQEQYVQINGKTLLSVSRVWQYGNQIWMYEVSNIQRPERWSSRSATFYNYDDQGNLLAEVSASETYGADGTRQTSGSFWLYNSDNKTWTFASAQGIDAWAVRSWKDYGIIEAAAQSKTVYVGGNGERYNWTHRVEYTRNTDGSMTAKAVYDLQGSVSIVQGEPDILSGETNDIKFVNGQVVNGHRAYYQEYWHQDANGNWVNGGYRLVFYDQATWKATAVDFPAQNTVELNGELFKITIEQGGKLILDKITVVPPTEQYVNELQKLLGKGYLVTLREYRMGMPCREGEVCLDRTSYRIFIQRNSESDIVSVGNLQSMSFNISKDGKPDWSSLQASYNGVAVADAQLLFEGVGVLLRGAICNGDVCTARMITDQEILAAMTALTVNKVDENGAIHFTQDGKGYKTYRDENGNVQVEEDLPPAVQAYVDELQKQVGAGYIVKAAFVNGQYQVSITLNNKLEMPVKEGQLTSLSFSLHEMGACTTGIPPHCWSSYVIDPSSLQATYSGKVDAKLLFEGLLQLQNYCPPGVYCVARNNSDPQQAIIDMTRITVLGEAGEIDGIRFEKDGQVWRVYRDEKGNVILEEELPPSVQAITAIVSTGLMNAFGFSKEVFDQLVKDGKIVIKVDLESLTATVTIDPSVQPVAGAGNGDLANLLALGQFPGEITFNLGVYIPPQMGMPCTLGADGGITCPPVQPPVYFLKDGGFSIGSLSYHLSYFPEVVTNGGAIMVRLVGDNQLHSVEVWQGPVCAKDQICPTYATRLIETLTFSYLSEDGAYTVEIRHLNVAVDGIATRLVSIERMQDGTLHIQSIEDRDAKGNVVANNKFVYRVLIPSCAQPVEGPANCGPAVIILNHIARTTAEGKPLSSIKVEGDIAVITLARGLAMEVKFTSLEQLLDVARQFESVANFDFPLLSTNSFEPLPLRGSSSEEEEAVKTDSNSLTAPKFTPISYQKRAGTSRKVFSSLRSVSAALSEPLFITGDQGSGVTPLFSFEKGNLLEGRILTELTK